MVTMNPLMRSLSVLTVALLLFSALPAEAQETREPGIYNPTTDPKAIDMFFHISGLQDFPVNTQKPRDDYKDSVSLGLATHSGCVTDPSGVQTYTKKSQHTWYGYSSPGYVEYEVDEGNIPRVHPERGISFDVNLDDSQPMKFIWYLQTQIVASDNLPANVNEVPNVVPGVILRATVREGDDISVGHTALNVGEIIAQGQTEPADLASESTQSPDGAVTYVGTVDGNHVYKFEMDLDLQVKTIDKDESYNVRVDTFMENPYCNDPGADGGDYIMVDWVRIHTSPEYRPKMTWSVFNPLKIEYLHPQFIGDEMVIHTSTNSPWGNYDVRGDQASEAEGGLEVIISGPATPVSFDRVALTARTHEHDHHTEAVDATWVWKYKDDNAPDGIYTVVFKAKNDQESAEAEAVAIFEIGSGVVTGCGGQEDTSTEDCKTDVHKDGDNSPVEESPGAGAFALLVLVAAAAMIARRRN